MHQNRLLKASTLQFGSLLLLAALQIVQLRILSHSLDSRALGTVAILQILFVFIQTFSDAGLQNYIVSASENDLKKVNLRRVCTLLSLFLFFSSIIFGIVSSPLYGAPHLLIHCFLISLYATILPALTVRQACAIRDLRQSNIIASDIISKIASITVLWWICTTTPSAYSFTVSQAVLIIIKYLTLSKPRNIPSYEKDDPRENRKLRSYVTTHLLSQTLNTLSTRIDELIIGRLVGIESLGVYSLIKQFIVQLGLLITPVARRIFMPILSTAANNQSQLNHIYLSLTIAINTVVLSSYAVAASIPVDILELIFGKAIHTHRAIYLALCIAWAYRVIAGCMPTTLAQATRRPDRDLIWTSIQFVVQLVVVAVSASHGLITVCVAMAGAYMLLALVSTSIITRDIATLSFRQILLLTGQPSLWIVVASALSMLINNFYIFNELFRFMSLIFILAPVVLITAIAKLKKAQQSYLLG